MCQIKRPKAIFFQCQNATFKVWLQLNCSDSFFLLSGDLQQHDHNHQVRKLSLSWIENRELVLKTHLLRSSGCFGFRCWNKFAVLFSVARALPCVRLSHQTAASLPSLAQPSTQDTGRGPMIEISAGPCVGDSIKKTITNGWTLSVHQHGSARRI